MELELEEDSVEHSNNVNQSNTITNTKVNTTVNADDTGINISDSGSRVGVGSDAASGVSISTNSDPSLNHCSETVTDPVKQHQ